MTAVEHTRECNILGRIELCCLEPLCSCVKRTTPALLHRMRRRQHSRKHHARSTETCLVVVGAHVGIGRLVAGHQVCHMRSMPPLQVSQVCTGAAAVLAGDLDAQ